jgi:hypothetical protein
MSDGDRWIASAGRHEIGVFCNDGALCRVRSADAAAYLLYGCFRRLRTCHRVGYGGLMGGSV